MMRTHIIVTILLITFVSLGNACWTEYNFMGMVRDAENLTPKNLKWVLEHYRDNFQQGLHCDYQPLRTRNDYIQVIVRDSQEAVQAFTSDKSYTHGAECLGRLARTISEMHKMFPSQDALSNPDWATDYAVFLQKKRSFLRIRWQGKDKRPRDTNALKNMLKDSNEKVEQVSKILTDTLNRENRPIASYDVRSAPFGVGSIAYSNAVNTIALTWLYVWDKSGGITNQ